jgi:hypothetical protein
MVENGLNSFEDLEKCRKRSEELENDNEILKKQILELEDRLRVVSVLKEKYEEELKRYRSELFLTKMEGIKDYNRELIALLRKSIDHHGKPRSLSDNDILSRLRISPKNHMAVQAIGKQLEILESFGLIEATSKGWRWKG